MKAAIVTGANGFLGGAVTRELLSAGYTVYALVRGGRESSLPATDNCLPVVCDLAEADGLEKKIPSGEASVFYHMAWSGALGPSRAEDRLQMACAKWTVDCTRLAGKLGCARFVCPGSIAEHDVLGSLYTQGARPEPRWVYGGAKIAARAMGMSAAASIGLDPVWATLANVYGPGDRSPNLLLVAMEKIIRGETPEFTEGTQNYDFVYVTDAARALRAIGERGRAFHDYYVGSGHPRPLREFLTEMAVAVSSPVELEFGRVPFLGRSMGLDTFDCSETKRDTGFRAQVAFGDGCRRLYAWLQGRVAIG